jgi:RNA polymerase sigma-70 factor, ECF subfamily
VTQRPESRNPSSPPWSLATEELERLRAGLQLFALRSLGDKDAAEEVAQETLARTLTAIREGKVDDPANVPAFARGVARHVIADFLRAGGRTESLDSFLESANLNESDPLERAVSGDEDRRVQAALAQLDPADRDLLRLSFFDGLTPLQIASLTGEPAERIRKRKSRALERLREAFLGPPRSHEVDSTSTTDKEPGTRPSRKAGES